MYFIAFSFLKERKERFLEELELARFSPVTLSPVYCGNDGAGEGQMKEQ
jgi:hypothetical protein